ncbi:MAG TPA: hypothetical protein PLX23_07915 [Candidatus Hydrogenedens sp.]|nr:hypothetical protein [Candidatus Hydrogenedens sp.]
MPILFHDFYIDSKTIRCRQTASFKDTDRNVYATSEKTKIPLPRRGGRRSLTG